jgi:hypothetical protein
LLVKEGGEEQKIVMLEAKPCAPFSDAALAQDDALISAPERFAD